MPSELRLTFQRDADGTGELFVEAAAAGFRGRASAWFNASELAEFGRALEAFPIPTGAPPALAGGFWALDGNGIEQAHVRLRVVPVNRRGTLAVQIDLATPTWPDDRQGSQHRAALEVLVDYATLQEFAQAVQGLATGSRSEATLSSTVTGR